MAKDQQPFKFRLDIADGTTVEGGAETKQLCYDHIKHCLRVSPPSRKQKVVAAWYLGRNASLPRPIQIRL